TGTGSAAMGKSRLGDEALSDISNVGADGEILQREDRRRAYVLGNRLWHTDASFVDPPGRYSMLSAKVIPSVAADTEFADLRSAYDALPADMKAKLEGRSEERRVGKECRSRGVREQEKKKGK